MSQKLKSVLLKRLRNCSIMRVNDESSKDMTKSLKNCRFTLIDWYSKNQHTSFKHKPLHWKNTLLCNTVHQSWEVQALIYITQCCKSIQSIPQGIDGNMLSYFIQCRVKKIHDVASIMVLFLVKSYFTIHH